MNTQKCRSCPQQAVWLRTSKGKSMPVNAETVQEGDTVFDNAKHVSHFSNCPAAKKWRSEK